MYMCTYALILCIDLSTEYNIILTAAQQSEIVKQTVQTEKNAKAQLEDIQQKMKACSLLTTITNSKL